LHPDLLDRVPKSFLVVGITVLVLQMIGCLLISEPPKDNDPVPTAINNTADKIVDDYYTTDLTNEDRSIVVASNDVNSLGVEYV
jgi:hypothetical protein